MPKAVQRYVNVPMELKEEMEALKAKIVDVGSLIDFVMFLSVVSKTHGGNVDSECLSTGESFEIRVVEIKDRSTFNLNLGANNA